MKQHKVSPKVYHNFHVQEKTANSPQYGEHISGVIKKFEAMRLRDSEEEKKRKKEASAARDSYQKRNYKK